MTVATDDVAVQFYGVVAGTPIAVDIPVYETSDVYVYYGRAGLEAAENVDYTVTLGLGFNTFIVTPTASLLVKINALITADPSEINTITVRRSLDYLTSTTPETARGAVFLSRELDRTAMRFQQISENINRCLSLSPNFVGDVPKLQLSEIEPDRVLAINSDGDEVIMGPTVAEIGGAAEAAAEAAASAALAEYYATIAPPDGSVTRPKLVASLSASSPYNPSEYGADPTGVAHAGSAFTDAEAVNNSLYLPAGATYRLGNFKPAKKYYGPGTLNMATIDFKGYELLFDPYRSSILSTPSDYTAKVGFPSSGYNLVSIVSTGADISNVIGLNRTTAFGSQNFTQALDIERCDAFGSGALRLMRYGMRTTCLGTIAGEQLGRPSTGLTNTDGTGHNYWVDAGGFIPGQVGWNYAGLETANPGIGAKLAAFTNYATQRADVAYIVGVGRDAFNGTVAGTHLTSVGYGCLSGLFYGGGMTAMGSLCLQKAIFHDQTTAAGYLCANNWQEGSRNLVLGAYAADTVVRGIRSVILGSFSGSGYTDINNSVLIGYAGGSSLTDNAGAAISQLSQTFAVSNINGVPLLSGKFNTALAGVNIMPDRIKGRFHIRSSDAGANVIPNTLADDLVIENAGSTGISLLSANTALQAILFGDTDSSNVGGLYYEHATDIFTTRVASVNRFTIDPTTHSFVSPLGAIIATFANNLTVLQGPADPELRVSETGTSGYLSMKNTASGTSEINHVNTVAGSAIMDLGAMVSDGTSASAFRFHRYTNTTNNAYTDFHVGDGSNITNGRISGKGNSFMNNNNGNFTVGATSGAFKFTVVGTMGNTGLPVYADNTAAVAGSVPAGQFYRTATGQLMVRY